MRQSLGSGSHNGKRSGSKQNNQHDPTQIKWISDFIWNIADDRLRDVYEPTQYRDVILPFIDLRRLDAVLEPTKKAVLERKRFLDKNDIAEQDGALRMAAGAALGMNLFSLWRSTLHRSGLKVYRPTSVK